MTERRGVKPESRPRRYDVIGLRCMLRGLYVHVRNPEKNGVEGLKCYVKYDNMLIGVSGSPLGYHIIGSFSRTCLLQSLGGNRYRMLPCSTAEMLKACWASGTEKELKSLLNEWFHHFAG